MAYMTSDTTTVLSWAADHLNLIGWPILLGIIWRVRGAIDSYLVKQKASAETVAKTLASVEEAKTVAVSRVKEATDHGAAKAQELMARIDANQSRIEANQATLKAIEANHLEHLAVDIKEMREDAHGIADKHLEVLQSIDTNIKILADRGAISTVVRRRK